MARRDSFKPEPKIDLDAVTKRWKELRAKCEHRKGNECRRRGACRMTACGWIGPKVKDEIARQRVLGTAAQSPAPAQQQADQARKRRTRIPWSGATNAARTAGQPPRPQSLTGTGRTRP